MEDAKILLWDIETTWGLRPDLTNLLCIAYMWHGEDTVYTISIEDSPTYPKDLRNDKYVVEEFLPIFNEANNLVTWYGSKFDEPYIRARAAKHRLGGLQHVHHDDLWRTCRYEFSLSSNRLENAAEFLDVEHEKEKLSHFVWHDATFGDKAAVRKIVHRCAIDVVLLDEVYEVMLPHIRSKMNVATVAEKQFACPWCGSKNVVKNGRGYTALTVWQKYQCKECGAWPKGPSRGRTQGKLR